MKSANARMFEKRKKTQSQVELEIRKLEKDNKAMEDRLKSLHENLQKQKEQRKNSAYLWKGGQEQKSLNAYAKDVLMAKNFKSRFNGVGQEADRKRAVIESTKNSKSLLERALADFKKSSPNNSQSLEQLTQKPITQQSPQRPSVPMPPTQNIENVSNPRARMWKIPVSAQPTVLSTKSLKDESFEDTKNQNNTFSNYNFKPLSDNDPLKFTYTSSLLEHSVDDPVPNKNNSLLSGTFDEAKNQKSFEDALMEWRNGRKSEVDLLIPKAAESENNQYFQENKKEKRINTDFNNNQLANSKFYKVDSNDSKGTETTVEKLPNNNDTILHLITSGKGQNGISYMEKLLLNKLRLEKDLVREKEEREREVFFKKKEELLKKEESLEQFNSGQSNNESNFFSIDTLDVVESSDDEFYFENNKNIKNASIKMEYEKKIELTVKEIETCLEDKGKMRKDVTVIEP
ncbi:hypothetical protein HDU92_001055 [Lobulomyces angularis]|nr:hypothetical protein HDU92_001055 [Lobulomyces angularis]